MLLEPLCDLGLKDRYGTAAIARLRLFIHLFSQHSCNRVAVVTGKFGDLDIGPAFLLEASKSLTVP